MIDTQAIKNKVLNLAMRGQLTVQLPEDGTAEELYTQIIDEKARRIKEGEIKKEKPLGAVHEEDIPFDIPANWKWVRLKDICKKIVDGDHNPPPGVPENTEYLMLSAQNINNDKIVNIDNARHLSREVFLEENKRTRLEDGDVLLTIVATLGRSCVYREKYNICFQRSVCVISTLINPDFLKRYLDCEYIQKLMVDHATGAAQPGFYLNKVEKICVPLPPASEQARIVERIEAVFEILYKINALQEQYAYNQEALKGKLMDAAFQGKMTEQLPEDGNAEELYKTIQTEKILLEKEGKIKKSKLFSRITEDDIPFNIPNNWKWVRLGAAINEVIVPQRDKPKRFEGSIPWCRIEDADGEYMSKTHSNQYVSQKIIDEMNLRVFPVGTVLSACSGGSIGRILITTTPLCTNQTFNGLVCSNGLYNRYLFHFLRNSIGKLKKLGTGAAMEYVSQKKIGEMLLPLPPLDEQHRIVKRIDFFLEILGKR